MKLVHLHVIYSKLISTECYAPPYTSLTGNEASSELTAFTHLNRCSQTAHIKIWRICGSFR